MPPPERLGLPVTGGASALGDTGAANAATLTPSPARSRAAAARLALARVLAWALLTAGWLALGALGRTHWPLVLGGLGAQVLWLAALGALLRHQAGRSQQAPAVRRQLVRWGLGCALALLALQTTGWRPALAALALGWAGLLVSASQAVRLLRGAQLAAAPSPAASALWGAALAWVLLGATPEQPWVLPLGLLGSALGLAGLAPAQGRSKGCHAGLFDCALPLLAPWPWRQPARWPLWAAAAGMLPMMAALPAMAQWCSAAGWPPTAMVALHLIAMLLPPWLLRHRPATARGGAAQVCALLLAGGTALVWRSDLSGLMLATLCHALAWGLAWRQHLACHRAGPALTSWAVVLRPALVAALLGLALAAGGPWALMAVHAGLAGVAALALPALVLGRPVLQWPADRAARSQR